MAEPKEVKGTLWKYTIEIIYNQDGKVDLIDDSDYKKLEEYRNNYNEKSNDLEMEMDHE